MKLTRLITAALTLGAVAITASAQAFDDDIYFDASKAPKKTAPVKKTRQVTRQADFAAADTYAGELTSSTRDVDEYNRRGIFAIPDSISVDSLAKLTADNGDAFANTRKIERFYNPEVVVESKDPEVAQYYYSDRPAEINIYVNNPYWGWGSGWYDPWYYGYYNPWSWGPSWSLSWGWGPSWSWGWGPAWGPAWGWGPSWNWGWGPAWGPAWGWGPSWGWGGGPGWGPVATRPEPPHGGNGAGSYRRANAAASGRYSGGSYSGVSSGRRPAGAPSSGSNWNINNVGTGTRPGSIANPGYRQGAAGSRGGSMSTGTGRRPGNGTFNNSNSGTRRNNNSYNNRNNTNSSRSFDFNNSGSSSRSSGGSFRSGGGGSFRNSGGGGGMRGGGGGGRRR